jgi:tetratricopeptide (TPR) repeat protein
LRIPVLLILAVTVVTLGHQSWRRARELPLLAQTQRSLASGRPLSNHQLSTLNTQLLAAFAFEPTHFDTAYTIAENFRLQLWQAGTASDPHSGPHASDLATNAIHWYQRAMDLNPYDPYPPMRYAMTLDWLGQHDAALPWYHRALQLDPNSYYTRAHLGWHYAQLPDWPKVLECMNHSLQMKSDKANTVAWQYIYIATARLQERPVQN